MRVAFVHDYLTQLGGAERVLLAMHALYPHAPIYTSLYGGAATARKFRGIDVRTTWLQKIPGGARSFRALLPLYPRAFESLDLRGYNLVISSTTSFAKGVRVGADALHVCYMNTPTRFLWYPQEYAADLVSPLLRPLLKATLERLRGWDYLAAQRPHRIIANSRNVAERIRACYNRECDVVPCPVDVDAFAPRADVGDYYLVVARLLPYKRVQLAMEACASIGAPLVIIGTGPDERRLRGLAGPPVRFCGRVSDAERRELYARARAVIVPGIEDFGLVPLEAAASGRPAIAFAAGGALETVVEGQTGAFFREPTAESLAQALQSFRPDACDPQRLVAHAARFSNDAFRAHLAEMIDRYVREM